MPLKPLRTMKEDAQDPSEQPPAQRLLPPNPHTMNQVIQTKNLPSPQVMDDEELQLYVQRLEKRHYRLSRKWWGMRRKYKRDRCPYCGMFTTDGSFCSLHQGQYDEYVGAKVIALNRRLMND